MRPITPEEIDALLPQTQCGLCGHGGCMPYSEAIVFASAGLNLCPPGGVKTMLKLGELLNQDVSAFIPEMEEKTKPNRVAFVREEECIGCTKCIQACPVDAILGSAKQMHSVIASECTACELCLPACPVDCIDMVIVPEHPSDEAHQTKADLARARYYAREKRLVKEKNTKKMLHSEASVNTRKNYIQEAMLRAKEKRKG